MLNASQTRRPWWLSLVGAFVLAIAGCGREEEIQTYTVTRIEPDRLIAGLIERPTDLWFFKVTGPAETVEPQADAIRDFIRKVRFANGAQSPEWTLPEGWTQKPGNELRFATIEIPAKPKLLEMTVSKLDQPPREASAPPVDFALLNLNRWRNQLILPGMVRAQIPFKTEPLKFEDDKAIGYLASWSGTARPSQPGMAPMVAGGNSTTPRRPPVAAAPVPQRIKFKLPAGWKEAANDTFSQYAFEASDGEAKARVTVSPLGPAAGGIAANVNRWRRQLGLAELESAEIEKTCEPIKVGQLDGKYIALNAPTGASPKSILGAIVSEPSVTWFIKLSGDRSVAEREQEHFKEFVGSLELGAPEKHMATDIAKVKASKAAGRVPATEFDERWRAFAGLFAPLASLRLTVVLMAMAIFVVFAGTLAQVDQDVWQVVHHYFRSFIAWIDLQVFFPRNIHVPGSFPFPGLWLIGAVMFVNLLAAHLVRFKLQAHGKRLVFGLAALVAAIVVTWAVVESGFNSSDSERGPTVSIGTLWTVFEANLICLTSLAIFGAIALNRTHKLERWILTFVAILLGGVTAWLLVSGFVPDPSSMRILWQLTKGTIAGLTLLGACVILFRKRAGIVVLHIGVGLMMFNELYVGMTNVENMVQVEEGQTVDYASDIRSVELAITERQSADTDRVVAIPESRLKPGATLSSKDLPFELEVVKYYKNADLRNVKPDEENPATAGPGLVQVAVEARASAGADAESRADFAAAYVKVTPKGSTHPLGTYLVSQFLTLEDWPDVIELDGKTYEMALRFKRDYKPYRVTLKNVAAKMYPGTQTPQSYSSDIRLIDDRRNVDRTAHIWMNNPLRYAGETFYQAKYIARSINGGKATELQLVDNPRWMIPYVGCMVVLVGMFFQFALTLLRFLKRESATPSKNRSLGWTSVLSMAVVLPFAAWIGWTAVPPRTADGEMRLYEFGQLPVIYEGRTKPLDTVARNYLRALSSYQTVKDGHGVRQPAIKWLLDVIADRDEDYRVFDINYPEVITAIGIEPRVDHRYTAKELSAHLKAIIEQMSLAQAASKTGNPTLFHKQMLEMEQKLRLYFGLQYAFSVPRVDDPSIAERREELMDMSLPRLVPAKKAEDWRPYSVALIDVVGDSQQGKQPDPAIVALHGLFTSYAKDSPAEFNTQLTKYQRLLEDEQPSDWTDSHVNFEAYFNYFEPFFGAVVFYLIGFILALLGLLFTYRPLQRAAFWLIAFTFVLHSMAMISRMYIGGRPPITNLYSSAIFVGWGLVVVGLILESIYPLGIGVVVSGVAGIATLAIAHFLAASGDTLIVMQAVLDTQFWLATHVTCISFGYLTTYGAGILGILYILLGVCTPLLDAKLGKNLCRMMYGVLCFALLFSFFGTVLGGLWADDSWGRFWGWDPKENGALIIVLWNAIVLHARWGGMVRDRGLANLAIGGNIVTSWSWFGVNQLGAGLHSYGFTSGVATTLLIVVASQLAIIALGALPRRFWWSSIAADDESPDDDPVELAPT